MAEKHGSRKNESGRVCLVFPFDIESDMATAGFKYRDVATHIASRNDARAAYQNSGNVGKDPSAQIGHNHDVELLRVRHRLHASVIHNHVVYLQSRIVFGDLLEGIAEKTVRELHNIGLVDAGYLLPVVCY